MEARKADRESCDRFGPFIDYAELVAIREHPIATSPGNFETPLTEVTTYLRVGPREMLPET